MSAPSLDNNANNFSPPSDLHRYRTMRYARQDVAVRVSRLDRLRKCCRCSRVEGGSVAVRQVGDVVGFAGLVTCGSVWSCSVCSAKIAARRRAEIETAITMWYVVLGGHVGFSTHTMRHHRGQGLRMLWDAVTGAWNSVTSGAPWQRAKDRYGVVGFMRLVEVTIGVNGWHVHIHALLFLYGTATPASHKALHGWMAERWVRALDRRGFSALVGLQDSQLVTDLAAIDRLADYFTKTTDRGRRPAESMALEFTAGHTKTARTSHGTLPVFSLLDGVEDGLADAIELWWEWEQGSHNRRQITMSKGLRDILALGQELDDETIASEEYGSEADDLVRIDREGWKTVLAHRARADVLNATQALGLPGLRSLLDTLGVSYSLVNLAEAQGCGEPDRPKAEGAPRPRSSSITTN